MIPFPILCKLIAENSNVILYCLHFHQKVSKWIQTVSIFFHCFNNTKKQKQQDYRWGQKGEIIEVLLKGIDPYYPKKSFRLTI